MFDSQVALIDDNHNDISPILDALSQRDISFEEFNPTQVGQAHLLNSVRVIFLDLFYGQNAITNLDEEIPASWIDAIVPDSVGAETHQYFLVIWSRDTDYAIRVLNVLHKLGKPPVGHLSAQKDHYRIDDTRYNVKQLLDNIPEAYFPIRKSLETIKGQIIDVDNDNVLINCRMSEKKSIFQVRRFDREPLEGVVPIEKNVFVQIDIETENGKRTIEFSQIEDDIRDMFVKDELFDEFRNSPFDSRSEEDESNV